MDSIGVENADFPWLDWARAIALDSNLESAFKGPREQVTLRSGEIIARFVTPSPRGDERDGELGRWWIPMSTMEEIADESASFQHSLGTVARVGLAVQRDWNRTMSEILVYRMSRSYFAWRGPAARQPYRGHRVPSWMLDGGKVQLYLPHLKVAHVVKVGSALSYYSAPRSNRSH